MRIAISIFFVAAICALSSCAGRHKVADGAVSAPLNNVGAFVPTPSVINIPAEIKIGHIEKIVNDQISGTIYKDDSFTFGGFSNVSASVKKNGAVKIQASGNELIYKVPLKISLRLTLGIPALGISLTEHQNLEAGVVISLRTKISLKNNWRLATSTVAEGYAWTSDPVVKIRSISIPIKSAADLLVPKLLGPLGEIVDKSISNGINIKKLITPLWEQLQAYTEISAPNIGERMWLRFDPQDVYVAQPTGHSGIVSTQIGIRAVAEASAGSKPNDKQPLPLPNFKTPDKQNDSFVINIFSEITFEQATAICREEFVGKTFKSGRQAVTVNDIEVTGANNLAKIKMNLSGSLNGTILVTGKAVYNESTQTLTLEDFDFDVKTDNQFQKARNWLLKGIVVAKMKPLMKFSFKEKLDDVKALAQEMLSDYNLYDGIVMNGKLETLAVKNVMLSNNAFMVAAVVSGTTVITSTQAETNKP